MEAIAIGIRNGITALTACFAACSLAACSGEPKEAPALIFEAETGVMSGVEAARAEAGSSGTGYVTGFDSDTDSLAIQVDAPEEGLYELTVGYRSAGGDKVSRLSLNGKPSGDLPLAASETFAETYAGKVLLNKGANEIGFASYWGWYDLDYVSIRKAAPRPAHAVENKLVNPNASEEALALHKFLVDQYGKSILSGQQTYMDALRLNWDYGKFPAVVGFDLIEYSPSRAERGSKSEEIEDAIKWHEMGGIVTFAWHWNAPSGLYDSEEQPWWKGFYTEGSSFDIEKALADPESEEYRLIIRDIDVIAEELKRLQEARVPVLWRPLHEAEGGWFWWGAKGPEPAKELWKLLYVRLTNVHQLNNLIWIWNSERPEWYPGDDTVDIVSVDSYPQPGDYSPVSRSYDNLVRLVQDKKLVALTENGPIPDPELLRLYEAHWSWFCTWTGEFIDDGIQNDKEHIRYVLNHDYVLTLDELPDF